MRKQYLRFCFQTRLGLTRSTTTTRIDAKGSTRRARQNATGADDDGDGDDDVGERGENDGRRWTTRGEDGG